MAEFLSARDLSVRFNCARSSIWNLVKEPGFPAKYRLGPQLVRWHRAEIEAWEAERRVG